MSQFDELVRQLATNDTKKKLTVGQNMVDFLGDPENPIESEVIHAHRMDQNQSSVMWNLSQACREPKKKLHHRTHHEYTTVQTSQTTWSVKG